MRKGLQESGPPYPREDQLELSLGLGPPGRMAVRVLQCKSSEGGDGRRGVISLESDAGRMHASLDFAVSSPPKEG